MWLFGLHIEEVLLYWIKLDFRLYLIKHAVAYIMLTYSKL